MNASPESKPKSLAFLKKLKHTQLCCMNGSCFVVVKDQRLKTQREETCQYCLVWGSKSNPGRRNYFRVETSTSANAGPKAFPARMSRPSALALFILTSLLRGFCFLRCYFAEKGTNWIEMKLPCDKSPWQCWLSVHVNKSASVCVSVSWESGQCELFSVDFLLSELIHRISYSAKLRTGSLPSSTPPLALGLKAQGKLTLWKAGL